MKLFKYMKREHLKATLHRGTFRIGTLHEYRDIERLGDQIGDDGEGKREVHLTAHEEFSVDINSDDPRAIHMRTVMTGWDEFPSGAKITIVMQPGASVTRREDTREHHMYCVAMDGDAVQMRAFGYDSCLRINDAEGFLTELSNCLPDAEFIAGAPVQYRDRKVEYSERNAATGAFIKPVSYAAQSEFRALWEPKFIPISPMMITCPKALLYCEEIILT